MLTVIVPAMNSADTLAPTLGALIPAACEGLVGQVVVADGGSSDQTVSIADELGCDIVVSPRGRGTQLAAGVHEARHPWLLFLHADTVLEPGWQQEVATFTQGMAGQGESCRAAVFRFALDDYNRWARFLEQLVALRVSLLGLPYGDQGLLISRRHYECIGGFKEIPLMEDVDLVRRIGRRGLVQLRSCAITSADRYRRDGYVHRMVRNFGCLILFLLRVPPRLIVRLYG